MTIRLLVSILIVIFVLTAADAFFDLYLPDDLFVLLGAAQVAALGWLAVLVFRKGS